MRSKKFGRDIRGVLPKSFPLWLNTILHNWTYSQVRKNVKDGDKVLDLGCGYGRVAKEVLKGFPKSEVFGVDISKTYVDIFNKDLSPRGRAVVSDLRKLPFENSFFNVVFMITTLMYLRDMKSQEKAISEIFRVLKKGGKFVFIERNPIGHKLMTMGGLITKIRGKKHREINSVSFSARRMEELILAAGGHIRQESSFPFGSFLTPSLYISYSGKK